MHSMLTPNQCDSSLLLRTHTHTLARTQVAQLLCDEVAQGGCVDSSHQPLTLLYMTLCPEDVSRVRFGKLRCGIR
jgi:hypothetical protein